MTSPLDWLQAPITSPFGDPNLLGGLRTHASDHNDYGTSEGTPIGAVQSGVVTEVGTHPQFGNYVVVKGLDGHSIRYFHGSSVPVQRGQKVNQGDVIMVSGNTGASTGPHTSMTVMGPDGTAINPSQYVQQILGNEGTVMPDTKPVKKPSGTTGTFPTPGDTTGTSGAGGGFLDPYVNKDIFGDPGLFASALGDQSPLLAVMRAMAQGGAPVFGGPSYLQDVAQHLANFTSLSSLLRMGQPGSFGDILGGSGIQGALDPSAIKNLVARLLAGSQGKSGIDMMMGSAPDAGGAGAQTSSGGMGMPGQGGNTPFDVIGRAIAGQNVDKQSKALEGQTGVSVANPLDYALQDPRMTQAIGSLLGFGGGAGGQALQGYIQNVILPAYAAFQREQYPTSSNPLQFLAKMMG